jgi:hypothetical protein
VSDGDPFEGLERDLDYENVADRMVELHVIGSSLPEEDGDVRYLLSAGMLDLLAEAAERSAPTEEAARTWIERAFGRYRTIEPTLRFWLFERGRSADEQEMLTRVRGREIAVTREWMIPRLRSDIDAYRARIEALRQRLAET